jgi:membrane-bound lytic murein transglycosylase A
MKALLIVLSLFSVLLVGLLTRPVEFKLHPSTFTQLPQWSTADTRNSLQTFKKSCRVFLKQSADKAVGSDFIALTAQDWYPACRAALALPQSISVHQARVFFETWFTPTLFTQGQALNGLFTGYYVPQFPGSLVRTKDYTVPLYALPNDRLVVKLHDFDASLPRRTLVGRLQHQQLVPYPTRAEINQGALHGVAQVLVWVKSPIDRLFLEIQGSGEIVLPNGELLYLGYAGGNGAPYTAIGRVLIERGLVPREQISMQTIRNYLESHPEQADEIISQNKSAVFFTRLKQPDALGTQGAALTPGYSLAVDTQWVPLGCPVWLQTTRPDAHTEQQHPLTRLMVAQDTGGAIKGPVRGDVFWGGGEEASAIAGKMKQSGRYWLLLPKAREKKR